MADVIKSIGTTSRDYSTLTLWRDDLDDTIPYDAGDVAIGELYDDSDFDESVTINLGDTIGLSRATIRAHVDERHDGTRGTGVTFAMTGTSAAVTFAKAYGMDLEWIEVDQGTVGAHQGRVMVSQTTAVHASDRTKQVVRNCLFYGGSGAFRWNVIVWAGNRPLTVQNCQVFGTANTGASSASASAGIGGDDKMDIVNCTVHGLTDNRATGDMMGISGVDAAALVVKNNLVTDIDSSTAATLQDYETYASATFTTCMSEDTTGSSGLQSITTSDQYESITGGAEDLSLKAGADAIGVATDLVDTPVDVGIDIKGRDRDAEGDTWDCGAHQSVSAATGPKTKIYSIIY